VDLRTALGSGGSLEGLSFAYLALTAGVRLLVRGREVDASA